MNAAELTGPSLLALLEALLPVARDAGRAIMRVYETAFEVHDKTDDSPVTEADVAAERIIIAALTRLTPQIAIVAEEQMAAGHQPVIGSQFWLIDPLDGTREFVKRNGEFTVNIGLIQDGVPVLGIVFQPAVDRLYAGVAPTGVAPAGASASGRAARDPSGPVAFEEIAGKRQPIVCRAAPADGVVVACSRSHGREHDLDQFLSRYSVRDRVRIGSSIKFGLIAAGLADLYPRLSPTMEWDTAAGHAVLRAAGGSVTDLQGESLRYGKAAFRNGHFVARGA